MEINNRNLHDYLQMKGWITLKRNLGLGAKTLVDYSRDSLYSVMDLEDI